ncbi:MAG: hypothetical protein AAF689_11695 [Pseudomonadota bacterium]
MIRTIALVALTSCLAGACLAQGTVRTGEHGSYTRVVVPIGAERSFEVSNQGRNWQVTLSPAGTFNTNRVFSTLFTERLRRIESDGDLRLELGCACTIDAYRYEQDFLILDISEAPEPPVTPVSALSVAPTVEVLPSPAAPGPLRPATANPPSTALPYRPRDALAVDLLAAPQVVVARLAPLDMPNVVRAEEPAAPTLSNPAAEPPDQTRIANAAASETGLPDALGASDARPEDVAPTAAAPEDITATAQALAEQLARAASAGLLESARQDDAFGGRPAENDAPQTVTEPDPQEETLGSLPVRAANAFDIAGTGGGLSGLASALSCSQPIGDMTAWSSGLGFEQELGRLRQEAYDAQGALRRGPTIALARYFIYHGFGAEAENLLQQLEDPPQVERAMARYLDDQPGPNFPTVETLALCSGLDLLWRFVDARDFPELSIAQRQDMRLAFADLPMGLRRILGPDYVRRLAESGYSDDATDIREALARGPTLEPVEEILLVAETADRALSRSETETLGDALETAGPDVARVMREYLSALREGGEPPEEGQITAAEALLRETEPDAEVGSLWHEVLLARTARGDTDAMFAMLREAADLPADRFAPIQESVVTTLLDTDQTAALVVLSTRLAAEPDGPSLQRRTQIRVFDVLSGLGLANLATAFAPATPMPDRPNAGPSQNWVAAAEPDSAEAAIAERISALQTPDLTVDPADPDVVRATIEDSRTLRAQLQDLLN